MTIKTGLEYVGYIDPWTDEERLSDEEIVRCRDCRHYSDHEWVILTDVSDVCDFWNGEPTKVAPDGFCAWGERKEGV